MFCILDDFMFTLVLQHEQTILIKNEFILVVLMSLGIFNIQEYVTFLIKGTQMMFAMFDYVGNRSNKKYPSF